MKRVVPKKNLLKNLIFIQENKTITRRTVEGMFRAFVEPLLNSPQEGLVVHRLLDKEPYQGLLSRLKYIDVKLIDYTKETAFRQDVWENTEFLCILTHRYGIVFIWDYSLESVDGYAGYYLKFNSRLLDEGFEIINDNSKISLKKYMETLRPDRRDNDMLNSVMLNLFDMYNAQAQEAIAVDLEREVMDKSLEEKTGYDRKTRYVAHEIKNQLSICELYSQIIRKYCQNNDIQFETIDKALDSINKSVQMANNHLISLKTIDGCKLEPIKIKSLVEEAVSLAAKILIEHFNLFVNLSEIAEKTSVMIEPTQGKKVTNLDVSIDELELSVRSYNCLKRAGINTVKDLTSKTEEEIGT